MFNPNKTTQILGERGLPGLPGAPGQQGVRGLRGLRGEIGQTGKQGKQNSSLQMIKFHDLFDDASLKIVCLIRDRLCRQWRATWSTRFTGKNY